MLSLSCQTKSDNMKTSLTIVEKIVSTLLLIVGILLTYQAVAVIYAYHFTDMLRFESYMICMTTLVSNLINGVILVISSLIFFFNKQKGRSLYVFSGIMLMMYTLNLNLLDIIIYSFEMVFMLLSTIIFLLGLFIYLYYKKKASFNSIKLKQERIYILSGIMIYLLIDIVFHNWHPLVMSGQV